MVIFHSSPLFITMNVCDKLIELECKHCHRQFWRELKEYRRKLKNGNINFYCSLSCAKKSCIDEFSPFRTFLISCRKNVRLKKLEYNLDLPYLKQLWEIQKGICPYSKIPMKLYPTLHQTQFLPSSASLDRIDSTNGYIKGNVQFVCLAMNYAKNRFEHKDFLNFINIIRK